MNIVRVKELVRPTVRSHRYLHQWMIDNRPLVEGEDDFIHHIYDLFSLERKDRQQRSPLDDFIKTLAGGGSCLYVCTSDVNSQLQRLILFLAFPYRE